MSEEVTPESLQCECTDLEKTVSRAATQVHLIFYGIICFFTLPSAYFGWIA